MFKSIFSGKIYLPAKPYPWVRRGCDWKLGFDPVHFNVEAFTTPWQPPFSWYPRGSVIEPFPGEPKQSLRSWQERLEYIKALRSEIELLDNNDLGPRYTRDEHCNFIEKKTKSNKIAHYRRDPRSFYEKKFQSRARKFDKWLGKTDTRVTKNRLVGFYDQYDNPGKETPSGRIIYYINIQKRRSLLEKLQIVDSTISDPIPAWDKCYPFDFSLYGNGQDPSPLTRSERHLTPLYSVEGIYERNTHKPRRPRQSLEENGGIEEPDDPLNPWDTSDLDKDPGDYAIVDSQIDQEYAGDIVGWDEYDGTFHEDRYSKTDIIINRMPYQNNTKSAGTASRTARDGSAENHNQGRCKACGEIIPWAGICLKCGDQIITPAIDRCIAANTLANPDDDGGIYVPFDEALYKQSYDNRVKNLADYYKNNGGADKIPDEFKPRLTGHTKHERVTLEDPLEHLEAEDVKKRQIFRVLVDMLAEFEASGAAPQNIIKAIDENYPNRRRFSEKYHKFYGGTKLTSDRVHEKMEWARKEIEKKERRNRHHLVRLTKNKDLNKFIKNK